MARPGGARQERERGLRQGLAWRGKARQGMSKSEDCGTARLGMARRGKARA